MIGVRDMFFGAKKLDSLPTGNDVQCANAKEKKNCKEKEKTWICWPERCIADT